MPSAGPPDRKGDAMSVIRMSAISRRLVWIVAPVVVLALAGYLVLVATARRPAATAHRSTAAASHQMGAVPHPGRTAAGARACSPRSPFRTPRPASLKLTSDDIAYAPLASTALLAGWQAVPQSPASADPPPATGYAPLDALARAMSAPQAHSGIRFSSGNTASLVEQNVALPTGGAAPSIITAFAAGTRDCGSFQTAGHEKIAVRPIAVVPAGDGSAAVELSVPTSQGTVPVDVAAVEVGPALTTFYLAGRGVADTRLLNHLITEAVARIRYLS